ncbi:unnamed protein product [Rotaria sordida]|uniref:Uncharacterized protein n=1 Tax=Rotaria sordida TaxID=392033 RepID=A0A814ZC66_9BILA|nr:unnamed protein product [Rotaria sordida]CAF1239780.1 unnamed protein product [Rotaria sordida]CAF1263978.1 unnamed protein product [Rotaria sordida]CAF4063913.1 unnamed protein product [Rotaria sordida]
MINKSVLFFVCLIYISILNINPNPIRISNDETKQIPFYFDSIKKLNNHIYLQEDFQIKSSSTNHPYIQSTTTTQTFNYRKIISKSTINRHRTTTTTTTTENNHSSSSSSTSTSTSTSTINQYDQYNEKDDSKTRIEGTDMNNIEEDKRKKDSFICHSSSQRDNINKDKQLKTPLPLHLISDYNRKGQTTISKQLIILDV